MEIIMKKTNTEKTPLKYDELQTSSFQDQTGLIPAGTVEESELEEYYDIYPIFPKVPRSTKQ